MDYRCGEFYFLLKGFCKIYDPKNLSNIQDKFIPKSIWTKFYLNEYISPNFIIINKINENLLIFYNNKFGVIINHNKIKLKNSNE